MLHFSCNVSLKCFRTLCYKTFTYIHQYDVTYSKCAYMSCQSSSNASSAPAHSSCICCRKASLDASSNTRAQLGGAGALAGAKLPPVLSSLSLLSSTTRRRARQGSLPVLSSHFPLLLFQALPAGERPRGFGVANPPLICRVSRKLSAIFPPAISEGTASEVD